MDIGDYISVAEAAEIMQKDPSLVQKMCRAGKLDGATKKGRDWLIPRKSAENYTPGPRGFAARPRAPTIPPEWLEVLSLHPHSKNGS